MVPQLPYALNVARMDHAEQGGDNVGHLCIGHVSIWLVCYE